MAKKVHAIRGGESILKVSTPKSHRLRALADAGLIVPDEIPSHDEIVPLDFTTLADRDVGAIHSRFAVRHAHAIYHVALAGTKLVTLRRDLRIAQAKFRLQRPKQPKNITDAEMEEDEHLAHLLDRISIAEANAAMLSAVAQGYEDLRNAASREMTRRLGERAAVHDA